MARIGTNIGMYPNGGAWSCWTASRTIRALRFPPRLDSDDRWLLEALVNRGIQPWLVLDGGALGPIAAAALRRVPRPLRRPPHRVADRQRAGWQRGRLVGHGSGRVLRSHGDRRSVLGPEAYLVAGGLSGGWAGWLDGVDLTLSTPSRCIPYGRWARRTPRAWLGLRVGADLLWSYRDQLNAMGYGDLDLHVTEYGAPRTDLGTAWGGYIRDMTRVLSESGLVNTALQFCLTDRRRGAVRPVRPSRHPARQPRPPRARHPSPPPRPRVSCSGSRSGRMPTPP
jgi:hypothetical protein